MRLCPRTSARLNSIELRSCLEQVRSADRLVAEVKLNFNISDLAHIDAGRLPTMHLGVH